MPERESKTSTVPNVWATFGIFSLGAIQIISCRAWLVIMDETWLYNYDPEAKQQSIKSRQSGSHHPKKSRVQKSAGNVLASIFWIKTASSSLIIFQRDKLSTRSITHLCWWKKSAAGRSPSWSCSCTTIPRLTGHFNPEEAGITKLPVSWSPTLLSGSGPVGLPPVLWTEKQLKGRHFSSDATVISAAETWLDGQLLNFFWVACKS